MSVKTQRSNGDSNRPTYGASMITGDSPATTKAGLNISSTGQVELWDAYANVKKPSGLVYANTAASTAITNTTTETAFDSQYTIPANALRAGSKIRVRWQGIATATNGTDTLAIKVYIGGLSGTLLVSAAAVDVANNDLFGGEVEIIVRTAGASGTAYAYGTYKTTAAEGTYTVKDDFTASFTLDTTATQLVTASATWSVANAGNSCRMDMFIVEIAT